MKPIKYLSIPTTYFIDSKGIIQNKYIGAMNLEDDEAITQIKLK